MKLLSPDFIIHNPALPEELRKGAEGVKKYASALIAAVSDRNLVQDDVFAKGDKVLIRWSNSGTSKDLHLITNLLTKDTSQQALTYFVFQMAK